MKLYLIRHGKTEGNLKRAYIGRTDQPLCEQGVKELKLLWQDHAPAIERLYVSPMLRCRQTAGIIFPGIPGIVLEDLRECDFGRFEGKNHKELDGDPLYQAWIDAGGFSDFPEGETLTGFQKRCTQAFCRAVDSCLTDRIIRAAFVVHGGTIMSVMDALSYPHKGYYDWMTANGQALEVTLDQGEWLSGKKALYYGELKEQ